MSIEGNYEKEKTIWTTIFTTEISSVDYWRYSLVSFRFTLARMIQFCFEFSFDSLRDTTFDKEIQFLFYFFYTLQQQLFSLFKVCAPYK